MSESHVYLFEAHDNGYGGCIRTYFFSNHPLTQDLVSQFIRENFTGASRMGSSFHHLRDGAATHGYELIELKGQHKVEGVLQNITGNY